MVSSITETHLTQSEPHPGAPSANPTVLAILFAISFSHLLNDTIQSLIPAMAVVLAAVFLQEPIRPGQIVGGAIIIAGVAILRRGTLPGMGRLRAQRAS